MGPALAAMLASVAASVDAPLPTDYCANCGDPLRESPTGGRYACTKYHGGNQGFYRTTAGPPPEPFEPCGMVGRKTGRTLYLYGMKKGHSPRELTPGQRRAIYLVTRGKFEDQGRLRAILDK